MPHSAGRAVPKALCAPDDGCKKRTSARAAPLMRTSENVAPLSPLGVWTASESKGIAERDALFTTWADAGQNDGHADPFLDEFEIVTRGARKVIERARAAELFFPTGEGAVDGFGRREAVDRKVLRLALLCLVADAHLDLLEPGEHIELRDRDAVEPIDRRRIAQRRKIEPAGPARTSRHGSELRPDLSNFLTGLVVELGRERTSTDARRVGLHETEDVIDARRTNT